MRQSRHVMVCGLGQSGLAAARLLRAEGVSVLAVDERDTPEGRRIGEELEALGCTVLHGAAKPPEGAFDLAVVSPGLSVTGPFLSEIRRCGIPLLSEMELGWSRFKGRTIAVTGSNGKSSVVKALADCFALAGLKAVPCGNYGLPVCQAVSDTPDADWLVIEVSSFQLETCAAFRPGVGILLNVLPNHLDRHGTMEVYTRLKASLFAHQREGDVALIPPEWCRQVQPESPASQWQTFGSSVDVDFIFESGCLREKNGAEIRIEGSYFDNEVLGPNAAALFGAARAAGLPPETIQSVLREFVPLPHRAQVVDERDGVRFVDDSKATNLSAMIASIRMQNRPVWLIAGGRPKEMEFSAAIPLLREKVKGVFLVGEAASAMAAAWGEAVPCECCGTLERAVEAAHQRIRPGDTVLLAPACTSYDQFPSYAVRGLAFQKFVSEKG